MKKILYLSVCLFVTAFAANAQSKDEKEVAAAVEKLDKAIIDADSATLQTITTPELTYGHSNGKVENKNDFINTVLHGPVRILTINLSDQRIIITGDDAIVRHIFSAKITNNGTPADLKIGALLIWKKQKGKWYLLARQGYKI